VPNGASVNGTEHDFGVTCRCCNRAFLQPGAYDMSRLPAAELWLWSLVIPNRKFAFVSSQSRIPLRDCIPRPDASFCIIRILNDLFNISQIAKLAYILPHLSVSENTTGYLILLYLWEISGNHDTEF